MISKINISSLTKQEEENLAELLQESEEIYIKNSAAVSILKTVNTFLYDNDRPVVLNIEVISDSQLEFLSLNILQHLSNIKQLDIYITMGEINDIGTVNFLNSLEKLRLRRYFKKGLNIDFLIKYSSLKFFELENGLNKRQHVVLNKLPHLETLRVSNLDLKLIETSEKLKSLRIYKQIDHIALLSSKFPELTSLYLEKCIKTDDFTSIGNLKNLKSVWLRYMKNIEVIPAFVNYDTIQLFQTTSLPKLKEIESVFYMKNLKGLMMTDLEQLKAADFKKLTNLKSLEAVYITFKDKAENENMRIFIENNNWTYKQPGLANKKFDTE